jgi:hypothetical protein
MAKINAYLTYGGIAGQKPQDLQKMDQESLASLLALTAQDMSGATDWVLVGTANVTIDLFPADEQIERQAEALRAQITKHRADSQLKLAQLEGELQKLLAITCEA